MFNYLLNYAREQRLKRDELVRLQLLGEFHSAANAGTLFDQTAAHTEYRLSVFGRVLPQGSTLPDAACVKPLAWVDSHMLRDAARSYTWAKITSIF